MKTFEFEVLFGVGPKVSNSASFILELNDAEIAYLKDFLAREGDCDYGFIEYDGGSIYPDFDNKALFEKINDAANDAVMDEINRHRKKKVDYFDIDWSGMSFDFIWPEELLKA